MIVPVRSERPSWAALSEAMQLAERSGADLQLLAVVDSPETLAAKAPSVGTPQGPPSYARTDEWAEECRHEAAHRLDRLCVEVLDAGFTGEVRCEVREGWPGEEIAAAADGAEAVAIVMPVAPAGEESFPPELAHAVAERTAAPVVLISQLAA